jgi:phenylalanyl-tRNA synthetase beta chain
MNILISYNWLKEYVKPGMSAEDFAARVSLSGPGIEHLYDQADAYRNMVVGKIKEIVPHPKADKLKIATTHIGTGLADIVCGGSNIVEGQWVAVATSGAKVRWHGEGEPVTLEPVEIRGVRSDGMICAANEIGLFDAFPHAEREILDLGAALPGAKLEQGMPLAKALGVESDIVMDIEVTTNRTDAYSVVGMARECAAILDKPFTRKESFRKFPRSRLM